MASFTDKFEDDLIKLSVDLSRAEAGVRKKVVKKLRGLERDLIRYIKEIDPTEAKGKRQMKRLDKLLSETKQLIKQTYRDINIDVRESTASMVDLTYKSTLTSINAAIGADIASSIPPVTARLLATNYLIDGAKSSEWWSEQASSLNSKFKREMRDAINNGESITDMVRRVRGVYNPATGNYVGGIMSVSTRNAESLVRTSVINLTNQAKLDLYKANQDVLKGVQWVSTLDNRTTQICRSLDGLIWSLPNYKPVGHNIQWPGPTAHWGCRSTQMPVVKEFENLPKKKQKAFEAQTRQSRDEFNKSVQTRNVSDFDSWLKKQSVSRQKEILGETKYKIWKENKLSQRDLVDFTGRPLTITELEEKYAM